MDDDSNLRLQALEVVYSSIQDQLDGLTRFVQSDDPDIVELEVRYQAILPVLDRCSRAVQEVKRLDPRHDCDFDAFEAQYFRALARCRVLKASQSHSGPSVQMTANSGVPVTLVSSNLNPNLKPPDIPPFNGRFEKFRPFMEMFEAIIVN